MEGRVSAGIIVFEFVDLDKCKSITQAADQASLPAAMAASFNTPQGTALNLGRARGGIRLQGSVPEDPAKRPAGVLRVKWDKCGAVARVKHDLLWTICRRLAVPVATGPGPQFRQELEKCLCIRVGIH